VAVSWTVNDEPRYTRGRCIDVSEAGLRLELPVAVATGTDISLNAERIKISGQARVRHCTRYGAKYLAGVELSQALRNNALAALRDPQNLRAPAVV
jgi:hypothetical protein